VNDGGGGAWFGGAQVTGEVPASEAHLLCEVLPAFVQELRDLLAREGRPELAAQLAELRVIDRCRCGDDFCAMIYATSRPEGTWGRGRGDVLLRPARGMIILDVVAGRIATIEVLYRPEIRERLLALLP
jgi:hypothetical protein